MFMAGGQRSAGTPFHRGFQRKKQPLLICKSIYLVLSVCIIVITIIPTAALYGRQALSPYSRGWAESEKEWLA